jgi:hypothetical protein
MNFAEMWMKSISVSKYHVLGKEKFSLSEKMPKDISKQKSNKL